MKFELFGISILPFRSLRTLRIILLLLTLLPLRTLRTLCAIFLLLTSSPLRALPLRVHIRYLLHHICELCAFGCPHTIPTSSPLRALRLWVPTYYTYFITFASSAPLRAHYDTYFITFANFKKWRLNA